MAAASPLRALKLLMPEPLKLVRIPSLKTVEDFRRLAMSSVQRHGFSFEVMDFAYTRT